MRANLLAAALLAFTFAACGNDETPPDDGGRVERCEATEYPSFDPVNHEPQEKRLAAVDEMLEKFAAAQKDPSVAAAAADEVEAIYQRADLKLQIKVRERTDVHFDGVEGEVGPDLDQVILAAIDDLRGATTALDVSLAKQLFEKAGMYRFQYLSVMQELYAPSRKHYDEAFGYLGSGPTNAPAGQKGLARLATKRDGENGTTSANELFQLILDGNCALDRALTEAGTDTIELGDDAEYDAIVHAIDHKLQLVMAYSIGHELYGIEQKRSSPDEARVKLYEAVGFFAVVKPYLAVGSSEEQKFATDFDQALAAAFDASRDGTADWLVDFDAEAFLDRLEALYGIRILG